MYNVKFFIVGAHRRNKIKLKGFFKFFFIFFYSVIFKSCFFRIKKKGIWEKDLFKKTKFLFSINQVLKLFFNSLFSRHFKSFNGYNKGLNISKFYFLKILRPYFRFLYKFKEFRELSFICQGLFKRIDNISIFDLSFLKKTNNALLFSWDYSLRNSFLIEAFDNSKNQRIKLNKYINLNSSKSDNLKVVCNYINNTIFFFHGEFSFGPVNRLGRDTFINFVLFYRKFYLAKYQCVKNLVWVHLESKKKLVVNYFFDFLNLFKYASVSGFYSLVSLNFDNSLQLKNYLKEYYEKGLLSKRSKINFNRWFYDVIDTCLVNNLIPFKIDTNFKSFLFSFLYMSFCFLSQTYNFFKFLYLSFSILSNRFNFKGLPSLDSIRLMIKWLVYKWSGTLSSSDDIWLTKETNFILKKKYKDLKVWSVWKSYKNLLRVKKEYILLKVFTKSNEVFFEYYLNFFGEVQNLTSKFKGKKLGTLKFFQSVESRLDILLYRLGFLNDLFYLRKCISLGWFLVDSVQIKFPNFFILLNIIVMPTLKASISLFRQYRLFKLSLARSKKSNYIAFWFKSKFNYLRYLEVNFNSLAFIMIRRPIFGEITYISGQVKFTKKRFPLFENVKAKHYIFSKIQYSKFLNSF